MKFRLLATVLLLLCMPLSAYKLGYALSGGGARGFAHIGVLKVLEEEGIRPDYIAGTSAGAIVGALYAMGYNAVEIESIAVSLNWQEMFGQSLTRQDLYIGQKRWAPYGNVNFELSESWKPQLPRSVYRVNNINLKFFELYVAASQVQNFEDLPIPFSCVATNLFTGKAKVLDSGSLMQAVRASMTVPSLLMPFEIGGNHYIDGGIMQNLPVQIVIDMGADLVFGIKTNSSLRDEKNLNNLIEVLDQTINIGMTQNLSEHLEDCDLIFEPELADYLSTDFGKVRQMIDLGEEYARKHVEQIRAFKALYQIQDKTVPALESPDKYYISEIQVQGNERLSSAKIREYTRLVAGQYYSPKELNAACKKGYNSELFQNIYPVLEAIDGENYRLIMHVKERANKILALNFCYNTDVKLTASSILRLNNLVQKNSSLIAELKLGGQNEFNLDYVKNFGELWGIYFRIFPYVNEGTMYAYDDSHHRTHSVKSLEWGFTNGVGVFGPRQAALEFFLYHSHQHLYRGIAESPLPPRSYQLSGFGLKGMHESVDDFVFPLKGVRAITKFNFARDEMLSDYVYSQVKGKYEAYLPITKRISTMFCTDIGSYFNSAPADKIDPYPIGGEEGFRAFPKYELSAPHYRILELAVRLKASNRLFLTLGAQHLSYSENELWGTDYPEEVGFYGSLGLKTVFIPIRMGIAVSAKGRVNSMLNVGYDFDIFEYSRK